MSNVNCRCSEIHGTTQNAKQPRITTFPNAFVAAATSLLPLPLYALLNPSIESVPLL
jgi:hypothetical protein